MRSSKRGPAPSGEPAAKHERVARPPLAEVRNQSGTPVLFVEGRAVPMLVADAEPNTPISALEECARRGIHLYRLTACELGWTGDGQFDPLGIDARANALLSADPEARFLLVLGVDAPDWWRRLHPEELAGYCRPERCSGGPACASWASALWRREAGDALARLLRHAAKQPWGGRLIGCQIAAGDYGEWRHPDAAAMPDIGPRMTERFRLFAVEKYRRNEGLLRKAWNETRPEFIKIACPTAAERRRSDHGCLRDPARSRRLLDYYESFFGAQNEAALHFCHVARTATEGRVLVGLAYAHVFGMEGVAEDGHAFPEPVLDSPDVDFIVSEGSVEGGFTPRALTGSIALREKLLFAAAGAPSRAASSAAVARALRAVAVVPAETDPAVLTAAVRAAASGRGGKEVGRGGPQFAFVVDLANNLYTTVGGQERNWLNEALLSGQLRELEMAGAPFAIHLLADLFHPRFPQYRVTMYANTLYASEAERRQIDARSKRSDYTAVWSWAPGVITEVGISADAGKQVCGQKLRLEPALANLRARIVEANDPLTWGAHVGSSFGIDRGLSPIVTIVDKNVIRLGANTANKTNFSVARFNNWTSVVFGAPPAPVNLIRNVLRAAGCHVYSDRDVAAVADGRFLAICTRTSGMTAVSLPGRYDVLDAVSGAMVASDATEFSAELAAATVTLYELRLRAPVRKGVAPE